MRPSIQFSERLIQGGYRYVFGVTAVDVNRDGALDLVAPDIREVNGRRLSDVHWYENDGAGNFRRHLIWENEPGWLERQAAVDLTGNGFADIVIVNNFLGHVLWFENDGRPDGGCWKRHVITTDAPQAYDVVVADLDGDGLQDVAIAGWRSNHISWYRNPGKDHWHRQWQRCIIDDGMFEARTMRCADFNGDGRIDLLCTSTGAPNIPFPAAPAEHRGSIVWYENTGDPARRENWIKHVIDDQSRGPCHGDAVDIDGDGKIDVVMAIGMRDDLAPPELHEVAWYENPGAGHAWKKHHVGKLPFAFEAIAADLDNDGQMEIVATAWAKGDRVVWFKHDGDPRGRWTMHILKPHWPAANQIIAARLTRSGRLDLVATADDGSKLTAGANELRWWRNDGAQDDRVTS